MLPRCPSATVLPWACTTTWHGMVWRVVKASRTLDAEMRTLGTPATTTITTISATGLMMEMVWGDVDLCSFDSILKHTWLLFRVAIFGRFFLGLNQPLGYYVVSAAVLVKLKPEFGLNTDFVSFVDTLIRDTANPSVQDAVREVSPWAQHQWNDVEWCEVQRCLTIGKTTLVRNITMKFLTGFLVTFSFRHIHVVQSFCLSFLTSFDRSFLIIFYEGSTLLQISPSLLNFKT